MLDDKLSQSKGEFMEGLRSFSNQVRVDQMIDHDQFLHLKSLCDEMKSCIRAYEGNGSTEQEVQLAREAFRADTDEWFGKSYFAHRARTWPRGYPGDFETLEAIYHGYPVSKEGVGLYIDAYFLTRELAIAIRERRAKLEQILKDYMHKIDMSCGILNIACGSSRELLALFDELSHHEVPIKCIDLDKDALHYTQNLVASKLEHIDIELEQYNALRMIDVKRNIEQFGMKSIIYSAGFFDYVHDKHLIKLLQALYSQVVEGGVLIIPFKDCQTYDPLDYQWFAQWHYFLLRTEQEHRALLEAAQIPTASIKSVREESGKIIFYIIEK